MRDDKLRFIGLDLETSGTSHKRSAPIEVGIALDTGQVYESLIGGWHWLSEGYPDRMLDMEAERREGMRFYEWTDGAYQIHGIERDEVDAAPHKTDIDGEATAWLKRNLPGQEPKGIIAVGWNVAAFDFPFVRQHLPRLSESMSYRSVDLNAIVFAITQAGLIGPGGEPWDYYGLKSHAKGMAAEAVRDQGYSDEAWHEAGYDALAGLYAFFILQEVLQDGRA